MRTVGEAARPIILFDGVCHLCNGFVQFVLRRDREGRFDFAPLQSEFARQHPTDTTLKSIILIDQGQIFSAEQAVLRIFTRLKQPWPRLARTAAWLPRRLLAAGYRFIARHRYWLWGREDICILPEPRWKGRFLS